MKRSMFSAALGVALLGLSVTASAETNLALSQHRFETIVLVSALPLDAEVLVDGRRIGLASDLVARPVSVNVGFHRVTIRAPGFVPYTATFIADRWSSASLFKVVLAPE